MNVADARPLREVRAQQTADTLRVYQAYSPAIAGPALAAQRFVSPFKRERMTWIKPSFTWMMYRCGWAEKPGQECVLGIDIRRDGFLWALEHASLSHYEPTLHESPEAFRATMAASPVRVQWDPERTLELAPLDYRAIQVGLGGAAVPAYVDSWITRIEDITPLARELRARLAGGDREGAAALRPLETPLALPPAIAARLGASRLPSSP